MTRNHSYPGPRRKIQSIPGMCLRPSRRPHIRAIPNRRSIGGALESSVGRTPAQGQGDCKGQYHDQNRSPTNTGTTGECASMLPKVSKEGLLVEGFSGAAAQQPQKKSAGERSIVSRRSDAVTERDPRRLRGLSPNSRQSRRRPPAAASSHQQDRDDSMDGSTNNSSVSFVGIDVSKAKFDVEDSARRARA